MHILSPRWLEKPQCLPFYTSGAGVAHFMFDDGGRTLAERAAPPEMLVGVDMTHRRCPYPGSRNGGMMNIAALKQLTAVWEDVLRDTAVLHEELCKRRDIQAMSVWHLWNLSASWPALIDVIVRRHPEGLGDFKIPARVSAGYKAAQGLAMTAEAMFLAGTPPMHEVTPEMFLEVTEDKRVYGTKHVCAGPPAMVDEFVRVAVAGRDTAPGDAAFLESVVGDLGVVFAYGEALSAMRLLFRQRDAMELARILDVEGIGPAAPLASVLAVGSTARNDNLSTDRLHSIVGMIGMVLAALPSMQDVPLPSDAAAPTAEDVERLVSFVRSVAPHAADVTLAVAPVVVEAAQTERRFLAAAAAVARRGNAAVGDHRPVELSEQDYPAALLKSVLATFAQFCGLALKASPEHCELSGRGTTLVL
ncbi:MAG TPA: hypothetical protein VHB21_04405 [Minicystis sp.]|nr:hypothetical protein [Minicystis sp.]